METLKTKYQKGEEIYILRSKIREAAYNPRIIGEGAEKRLRKSIKNIGLIGTLIWNPRTGNLISGNQRLKQLDFLEKYPEKNKDYEVRVTSIDLPEKEEKQANILFNNPSTQGEWDVDKLGDIIFNEDIGFESLGFTDADMAVLFGGDERYDQLLAEKRNKRCA